MTSLYFMQVFVTILLGIKGFRYAPIMIPIIFATLVYHVAVYSLFQRPWSMMSVHDAAMLDLKDEVSCNN